MRTMAYRVPNPRNCKQLLTHTYDGQLHSIIKEVCGEGWPDVSVKDKQREFKELIEILTSSSYVGKLFAISTIISILGAIGKPANFDPSNKLSADDLLYQICLILEITNYDNETMPVVIEQLADVITAGNCSQGRCTRLFQIYLPLRAALDTIV